MSNDDIVDKLKENSITEAGCSRYCLSCKLSYFIPNEEFGFCRYVDPGAPVNYGHAKIVSEYQCCPFWEKKFKE